VEAQPLKHLVPIQQYDLLPRYLIHAGLVFTPLSQPYLHEYGDDWSPPARRAHRARRSPRPAPLRPSAPLPCTRGVTLGRCRRYNTSPRRLCERALFWEQKREGQELVILSQVLQDGTNHGYETLCNLQVLECNGQKVDNPKELEKLIRAAEEVRRAPAQQRSPLARPAAARRPVNARGAAQSGAEFQTFLMEDDRSIVLETKTARATHEAILKRHRIAQDVQL